MRGMAHILSDYGLQALASGLLRNVGHWAQTWLSFPLAWAPVSAPSQTLKELWDANGRI
jgi:hypothetical protein